MPSDSMTVAEQVASLLLENGVGRVYGLCGGHIQPIWDAMSRAGIEIVDVRHEAAAVFMAHAESELTGRVGVAIVTAGPGLTNAVTAIANASVSRIPTVVISGRPPRPQAGRGAMQELDQAAVLRPLCRSVIAVHDREQVEPSMQATFAAAYGIPEPPGPAYVDFPTDLLDEPRLSGRVVAPPVVATARVPAEEALSRAASSIRAARRPLVISGHAIHRCRPQLVRFLDESGAAYLDAPSSRGAVPPDHPAYLPAMRSRLMGEADLVITLGRVLDYQLGYGTPAVFKRARRFIRIGASDEEAQPGPIDSVSVAGEVGDALDLLASMQARPDDIDEAWIESMRRSNEDRIAVLARRMEDAPTDQHGRMHPYRLIASINGVLDEDSIVVADGGDILSFARVGLRPVRQLDCGALGCLGVGVPFATSAALNTPGVTVVALIGDGAFGMTAIELDTARRFDANVVFVVANNQGWNIERRDQIDRFAGNMVGVELPDCRYDLVASGLGLHSERVESEGDLGPALARGLANTPALLDVAVSGEALSPDYLSGIPTVPPFQALSSWSQSEASLLSESD